MPRRCASSPTRRARCGSSAGPARARPPCCSPRSRARLAAGRGSRAHAGAGREPSRGRRAARAAGPPRRGRRRRPVARRWSAPSTPTRSVCSACTPPATAIRRPGCSRAPSRMRWSATCLGGEVDGVVPGSGWPRADRARARGAGVRRRAARAAAARRRAGARARTSWPSSARGTTSPSGRRRGGSSAATSRSRCCAGRRGGGRHRPRRPRSTRPSWWRRRSTRSRRIPSCSRPSGSGCATSSSTTRRISIRSRWSWSACSGAARPRCCSRAIPTRPSSPSAAPTRRACRPSTRTRWCSRWITAAHPPSARPARRSPPGCPGWGRGGTGSPRPAPIRSVAGGEELRRRAAAGRVSAWRGGGQVGGARGGCFRLAGGGRTGVRARVHLRGAGGRLDRRPAAPRASHRRRAVVADGGARALGAPGAPGAAAGAAWPRASRSPRRPTSCRWPANRRSCRC